MKMNFLTQMALHLALAFAAGVVQNAKVSAEEKAAAEKFITAGDEFVSTLGS